MQGPLLAFSASAMSDSHCGTFPLWSHLCSPVLWVSFFFPQWTPKHTEGLALGLHMVTWGVGFQVTKKDYDLGQAFLSLSLSQKTRFFPVTKRLASHCSLSCSLYFPSATIISMCRHVQNFIFCIFGGRFCSSGTGLYLTILLPPLDEFWDDRHVHDLMAYFTKHQ